MLETLRPPQLLVHDDVEPCPYLPGQLARLPMRFPLRRLSREELDERLAAGDRRQGNMLYHAACPHCQACQSSRVLVRQFQPNRSQRRAYQRGEQSFTVEIGPPTVDALRVDLYNRHKDGRGLNLGEGRIDELGYRSFLVDTCCETFELRYFLDGRLIGVAVADRGETALSAVYCYFDPICSRLSPGVYSVLKHIELCRQWNLEYLYLGFFIAPPSKMSYKCGYQPQERLIGGQWRAVTQQSV